MHIKLNLNGICGRVADIFIGLLKNDGIAVDLIRLTHQADLKCELISGERYRNYIV